MPHRLCTLQLFALAFLLCASRARGDEIDRAIAAADVPAIEKLIADNPDVLKTKVHVEGPGWTMTTLPLNVAIMHDKPQIARLLLAKGASPLGVSKTDFTPLHLAAWRGNAEIVAMLLAAKGVNVNAQAAPANKTPLHLIIEGFPSRQPSVEQKSAVIALLLKHDADPLAKDTAGNTPRELAEGADEELLIAPFRKPDEKPPASAKSDDSNPPRPIVVPFNLNHVVLVQGRINNVEGIFVYDTGATHIVITPAAAKAAGITGTTLYRTCDVAVGEAVVKNQKVVIDDLPQMQTLRTALGIDYAGVLGYDFVSKFVSTFDLRKKELELIPNDGAPGMKEEQGSVIVPFTLSPATHMVYIQARINGAEPLTFFLDSGADEIFVTPAAADKLKIKGHQRNSNYGMIAETTLTSFSIGEREMKNLPILIADPPQAQVNKIYGQSYDGLIGRTLFQHNIVTVDYRSKQMKLTPYVAPTTATAPAQKD